MMFSRERPPVQVDDRFVKRGDPPDRVWTITRLWTATDGLPHARMRGQGSETRIISVSALVDRHFYSPLPAKPAT